MRHQSHGDIIKRLKRAEGHLRKIISMMEDDRPCADVAQQMHAVERAIANAKRTLIHDHIDHCLGDSDRLRDEGRSALDEFKAISKYL
ncbi:metal-sensing transcriptional repressor [Coralliovum pocilloporae]|uniref:metal-sensing transcriptional repressor n=1 Tax=Coralliovum pocilloporae TaxID=3066369 RepID=UPI0033077FD5